MIPYYRLGNILDSVAKMNIESIVLEISSSGVDYNGTTYLSTGIPSDPLTEKIATVW
jgi:hypothetical protein